MSFLKFTRHDGDDDLWINQSTVVLAHQHLDGSYVFMANGNYCYTKEKIADVAKKMKLVKLTSIDEQEIWYNPTAIETFFAGLEGGSCVFTSDRNQRNVKESVAEVAKKLM